MCLILYKLFLCSFKFCLYDFINFVISNNIRVWQFVMEYYFQQPSTKYDWSDFKKKAILKDKAKELKRRMTVKNIHNTSNGEFIELKHVILHMNALKNTGNYQNNDFYRLLEFFTLLKNYVQDYLAYIKFKSRLNNGIFFNNKIKRILIQTLMTILI